MKHSSRLRQTLPYGKGTIAIKVKQTITDPSRIWDVENKRKQKTVIVVKSKERGSRTKVTACGYSTDASLIGGGEY